MGMSAPFVRTERRAAAPGGQAQAGSARTYDAIVVGSGISGGWAAKELTEKGMEVLLLERGRPVRHGVDYITEHVPPWEMEYRGRGDRRRMEEEQPLQSEAAGTTSRIT